MTDDRFPDLPDLPSDEELGIAGLDADGAPMSPARGPGSTSRSNAASDAAPGRGRGGALRGWPTALVPLLLFTVGGWLASADRSLPAPLPANAPDTAFASGRAMADLVELARAPRPVGSPEHHRARELVLGWLGSLGLDPEVQEGVFAARRGSGDQVVMVPVRNVVARIPGTGGEGGGAVLLTAHYDAVPLSHGAGDAGVGVVAVVETVRALLAGPPLERDVIVLITDAEEIGLMGARTFVAEHRWMSDVRVVLSAEMRGTGGPVIMFETGRENGWVVEVMQAADPSPRTTSLAVEVYRRLPNDTDFTPFREAGIQGLNFAGTGRAEHYHQATDRPEQVQEATLQHMGERLLALTRELGSRELGSEAMEAVRAPDRAFATLPVVGIVSYPAGFALPVSAGIFLLWLGLLALPPGRRVEGSPPPARRLPALLLGATLPLAAGALAVLAAWGLLRVLPAYHPELGTLVPLVNGEGWYMLALTLLAAAAFLALARLADRLAARWSGPGATAGGRRLHLAAGALTWLVATTVVVAFLAPLAVMELQVAAGAGVAGALVLLGTLRWLEARPGPESPAHPPAHPRGRPPVLAVLGLLATLLAAMVALGAMVPVLEGVLQTMSLRMAMGLAALVALILPATLPAVLASMRPGAGWGSAALSPLVLLVLALGSAGMGLRQAGGTEARPLGSTLLYTLDREVGEARWRTLDDGGFAWAESLVGPFGEPEPAHPFPLPRSYRSVLAPLASLAMPTVSLGSGSEPSSGPTSGPRRVQVEVQLLLDAERVSLTLEADGGEAGGEVAIRAVNGVGLPDGAPGSAGARRAVRHIQHQGAPLGQAPGEPGGQRLVLEVEVPPGATALRGVVVEEHLRGAELLGAEAFRRPPNLVPSSWGLSDRVLVRTPFRLSLEPGEPPEPPALLPSENSHSGVG